MKVLVSTRKFLGKAYIKVHNWWSKITKRQGYEKMDKLILENEYYGDANVLDLAHWFVLQKKMSHKKIQNLCYYAQAWSLALNNMDIIPGIEFEARPEGPINNDIWNALEKYGWNDKKIDDAMFDTIKRDNPYTLSDAQKKVLSYVWNRYGKMTANVLEALAQSEKPWLEARGDLSTDEESNAKIDKNTMRDYYLDLYAKEGN